MHKRRQYFIDRKFQTRFIVKFSLILLAGGCLSVLLTMLTTQNTLTSSFDGSRLAIESTATTILPSVVVTNIVTTLIVGGVAFVITLLVSHKIAGPMYRFEKDLKDIGDGDLRKKIHIRDGDQFTSVAINLNSMVKNVNGLLSEVQEDLDKLSQKAADKNMSDEFVEDIEKCKAKIAQRFTL